VDLWAATPQTKKIFRDYIKDAERKWVNPSQKTKKKSKPHTAKKEVDKPISPSGVHSNTPLTLHNSESSFNNNSKGNIDKLVISADKSKTNTLKEQEEIKEA
jgi:hypothetical protein